MTAWGDDILEAMENIGGPANYEKIYGQVKKVRLGNHRSWPKNAEAIIRREIQQASSDSSSWKGQKDDYFSVAGLGQGIWSIRDATKIRITSKDSFNFEGLYVSGLEGVVFEASYLKRSRNRSLVAECRERDREVCQTCHTKPMGRNKVTVIEVHHLNPLLSADSHGLMTKLKDLVCLCPTCHRIAHTGDQQPLSLDEIKNILSS